MSTEFIDITPEKVIGRCDLKCNYNFKYTSSNLTAKNNGIYLSFAYENSNVPSVYYNEAKYNVSQIMIYSPSLHLFNGSNTDAEMVIEHIPELGGNNLYVCIPIIQSSDTSQAGNMFMPLIIMSSKKTPADGESATMNMNNFTLNSVVPNKPFYSYQGDYFGSTADFIVYGRNNAIPVGQKAIGILTKIIQPSSTGMVGGSLFFNEKGPNNNLKNQGIYISCQPVNQSGEVVTTTETETDDTSSSLDFGNLGSGEGLKLLIQIIIGLIFFGILFSLLNYGYIYFTKGKMPDLTKISFTPSK